MFIKIRSSIDGIIYVNSENPNFCVCTGHYTYNDNFYYFKLFPQWFSYTELGKLGKFETSEQAEKVAEIIINSIINNVKLLDLNTVIENIKNNA